ncbi:MAG TPA: GNAT family protein [Acidimicrobiales bacterium]|nr:GNAT family protein [Acidimicrobiales bacterium]
MGDISAFWPLYSLRVRTGDIELRFADEAELAALATLALEDIHDPDTMPFSVPWSDVAPEERARSVLQWNWKMRAEWDPASWHLPLVTTRDGCVVGTQGMSASKFATTRAIETGSWLGRRYQGSGIGTAMRRAVLHLAFTGLGTEVARSGAFSDNATSLRVSEKLGYVPDGTETVERRGKSATIIRLVLTRSRWEDLSTDWPEVTIEGLGPALWMFGEVGPDS